HRDEFNWRELNPPEFHYSGSGWSALRQGKASTRGSWRWYSSGFVSEYATSSFGNDFSTLAEALFMGEPALWNPKFPILARKRDLAIAFYSKLNPSLNTFYFHELHEARASQLGLDPFPMSAPESKPPLLEGALSGNMGGSTR